MSAIPHRRIEHVVAVFAVVVAIGLYLVLRDPIGEPAVSVSIIPIAVIAATYGTKAGLLASAIAFPFNTFILEAIVGEAATARGTVTSSLISVSLFGVAWLFGRFHLLRQRLAEQTHLRAKAETALRLSEARLHGFLNATPDIIFRLGPGGRLLELYGAQHLMDEPPPKEELLFRTLDEMLPAEAAQRIVDEAALVREGAKRSLSISLPGVERTDHLELSLAPFGERDVVVIARRTGQASETR